MLWLMEGNREGLAGCQAVSRAGSLPQLGLGATGRDWSAVRPPSRASSLPQLERSTTKRQVGYKAASGMLLILGAPLNHAGRTQALRSGHPGMDAGIAALGHGWPFAAGPRSNAFVRACRA